MSISAAADAALQALKAGMPPLLRPGQIGLCSPGDAGDNFLLGLFLYNVARDRRYQMTGGIRVDSGVTQSAPLCVELAVMVTAYAGKKSGLPDDYKLLERVMQIWQDKATLPFESALQPSFVPAPRVELLTLEPDEVSKIWQFPGTPYRLSLFYRIGPVAVVSLKQALNARVGGVDYKTGGDA